MNSEDEQERLRAVGTTVTFRYAPSDEETKEHLLNLAGDDPARRAAILHWLAIEGLDVFDLHEDHLVKLACEDADLKPDDLRDLALFPEIEMLQFVRTKLSDEALTAVANHESMIWLEYTEDPEMDNRICETASQLPNLQTLILDSPRIDDQGAATVSRIRSLKTVSMTGANITSMAVRHLAKLPNLKHVTVAHTDVDDEGLQHICRLEDLAWLDLANTRITDEGVHHLRLLKKLKSIDLSGTRITDRSARVMSGLTRLNRVHISGTQISNESLAFLVRLPKLRDSLSLRNTAVDDNCVPLLETLTNLHSLDIRGTKISRAGAKRINAALKKYAILECDYGHLPRNPGDAQKAFEREIALSAYESALPATWFDSSLSDDLNGVWINPSEVATGPFTTVTVIKDMKYAAYRYNEKEMDPIDDFYRRGPVIGQSGVYFLPNRAALYGPKFLVEENGYKFLLSKDAYDDYVRNGRLTVLILIRVADSLDFKSPPNRPSIRLLGLPFVNIHEKG